jgi:hypothetical protein
MKKIITSIALVSLLLTAFTIPPNNVSNKTISDFSTVEETSVTSKTFAVAALKKYYKGNDGSYIYVRQMKNKVYAFAEHLNGSAASVIVGTITGTTLNADYYYVPKGEAKGKGKLSFTIGANGSLSLNRSAMNGFNIESMTEMSLPTRLPSVRRAWYRGNTPSNLSGRWNAQNVGESYVLETKGQIIMFSEGYRKGNNARPQFATLFIGKRNGNAIKGNYVDLPLGHTESHGEAGFNVEGTHKLVVNHKYYPGVKHERVVADTREILTTTKVDPRIRSQRPVIPTNKNRQ